MQPIPDKCRTLAKPGYIAIITHMGAEIAIYHPSLTGLETAHKIITGTTAPISPENITLVNIKKAP